MSNIRKNLSRYKELMTGSRLKELNNNIENYKTEINKLKKQQSFLDKMYDRNIMGTGKMRGNNWELAVKYPKSSRLDMYEKYMSNLEKSRDNINRKSKELSKKQIRLNRLKFRDELYAIGEEDAINATRKATAIGAAGLGGAGLATGGGVMAYKHFKKKKQQKNAYDMLDEIHMEKVAGIRQTATKKLNRYKELMTGSKDKISRLEDERRALQSIGIQKDLEYSNRMSDLRSDAWLKQHDDRWQKVRDFGDDLDRKLGIGVTPRTNKNHQFKTDEEYANEFNRLKNERDRIKEGVANSIKETDDAIRNEQLAVRNTRRATGGVIGGAGLIGGGLAYKHHKNKERKQ